MPDWTTVRGSNRLATAGSDAAASRGTQLSVPAANNTKGNYTQLVAATGVQATAVIVQLGCGVLYHDALVDIAVGGSGSEQVLAANLLVSTREKASVVYMLPVSIATGSRIAARYQSSDTSGARVVYAQVTLLSSPFLPGAPLGRVTTYGADTADSGGVPVDPGGSANTKGAYSEIAGSTDGLIRSLLIGLGCANNTVLTAAEGLVDIAIGAAGSEQIIIPDLWIRYSDQENIAPQVYGPLPVSIPAGVRLAARAQCSITDAADRIFDIALYGVD